MMTFARRRWRNALITIVLGGLFVAVNRGFDIALFEDAIVSGWGLIAIVAGLVLFRVRKAMTMLPLLSNAAWMQIHVYAGLLSIFMFLYHIGWSIPTGAFERVLGAVFVLVALSGVFGIVLIRRLPKRLARRGEEVIWERIPIFLARLREDAEAVVWESANETKSTSLRDFYVLHLSALFEKPRHGYQHLIASDRPATVIQREFNNLNRFLSDQERDYAEKLRGLVRQKIDLDFHYALQLALKAWLFFHVPVTYSLLILAVVHLILVYAFSGGL